MPTHSFLCFEYFFFGGILFSQGKLQRMVQMSAALAAQSVALEALQAANRTSTDSRADFDKSSNRSGSDAGSVTGSLGGAAAKSSLASFLEFQQTLSQRYVRRNTKNRELEGWERLELSRSREFN